MTLLPLDDEWFLTAFGMLPKIGDFLFQLFDICLKINNIRILAAVIIAIFLVLSSFLSLCLSAFAF